MSFGITLLSFPILIWAYFQFPLLNQFSWKWLIVAFIVYFIQMVRILARAVESPRNYGFFGGSSGGSGSMGGGFSDGSGTGGGDCGGGGGGDC